MEMEQQRALEHERMLDRWSDQFRKDKLALKVIAILNNNVKLEKERRVIEQEHLERKNQIDNFFNQLKNKTD